MRLATSAAAALLLAGCGASSPPPPVAAQALRTGAVELRDVELTVSADAVVEAVRQSTVSSQVSGRIVDIRFDVGDRVKQGDVIVRIDESAATQAVEASEAQLRAAQANLANARAQYDRSRDLYAQKFISAAALDKAEADFKAAESQMRAMLAGAGQARTQRGFATIVAPYSGVVSARHVQLGEMATPGKPLMTGFDPASLRIVATVASSRLPRDQAGQPRPDRDALDGPLDRGAARHRRAFRRSAHALDRGAPRPARGRDSASFPACSRARISWWAASRASWCRARRSSGAASSPPSTSSAKPARRSFARCAWARRPTRPASRSSRVCVPARAWRSIPVKRGHGAHRS